MWEQDCQEKFQTKKKGCEVEALLPFRRGNVNFKRDLYGSILISEAGRILLLRGIGRHYKIQKMIVKH